MPEDTTNTLETEVLGLVKTLKEAKKLSLANCIEANYRKTALTYSKELNSWVPRKPMEKELSSAFQQELERLDYSAPIEAKILKNIEKRRVLQTAPHLGATESPRMLCINWLGSLGVADDDFYIVGMYSGIPFSNRSRPGRINKENGSINLFPSTMQDGLVYKSIITEKLIESLDKLPEKLKRFLPQATVGASYTKWALEACANIEGNILEKENLVYLDINEVVTEYLLQVLPSKEHTVYKLFFDPKIREEFDAVFSNEILFYSPVVDGKYEKMKNVTLSGLTTVEDLLVALREKRWCPGLLTGFLVLAFLNDFKCLGSFAQVEYLPAYQAKLSILKDYGIDKIPTANLTTGMFPTHPNLYPVDIIEGAKFTPKKNILFGELLLPMKDVLLESYFTGNQRNESKK